MTYDYLHQLDRASIDGSDTKEDTSYVEINDAIDIIRDIYNDFDNIKIGLEKALKDIGW